MKHKPTIRKRTDLVIYFVFLSGQAVQELPVGVSAALLAECLRDLVASEVFVPLSCFVLLTHGNPEKDNLTR